MMHTNTTLLKKYFIAALALLPVAALAQRSVQAPFTDQVPVSYIRSWEPQQKVKDDNALFAQSPLSQTTMATQYLDGLGRPAETVVKEGSSATGQYPKRDAVTAVEYDQYGRAQFQYLPFAANATNGNTSVSDGLFKQNPFDQQAVYMAAQYPGETYFYGKTDWENNPLNRVTKTTAPGKWQEQSRRVSTQYLFNTAADEVIMWNVTDGVDPFGDLTNAGTYSVGTLSKTIITDEENHQVISYTDKEDKVILKKVEISAQDNGSGSNHTGWLCTYYMYDAAGQLRCVLQPEGLKAYLSGTAITNSTLLAEQCFRYKYDRKGRMTIKKVPGADEVRMVYDLRDRLVMMQDANMRTAHKWLISKYDEFNKPTETGLITDNTNWNNQAYHTGAAAASLSYPNTGNYTYDLLTQTYYDDYDWAASLPSTLKTYSTDYAAGILDEFSGEEWDRVSFTAARHNTPTGSKIKVLDGSSAAQYLYSVSFYDEQGRLSQSRSQNITRGVDVVTMQYDWKGKSVLSVQQQENATAGAAQTIITATHLNYDEFNRVVSTEKKISHTAINDGATPESWHAIANNEYDSEGKLNKKNLAPDYNSSAGLESETFDYNIRGWMLGMNRDYARDANNDHYFGFDLGYEKTANGLVGNSSYAAGLYNGNITGTVWKSKGDGEKRRYNFTYDAANRLTGAYFDQYTGGSFNLNAGIMYTTNNLNYDNNGNILHMDQYGLKINSSSLIDQLSYTYEANSNKLKAVTDASNDNSSKLGDFKYDAATKTSTDYLYDVNGNMQSDANKKISSIVYNHLNLPQLITVTGKGTIAYVYDAEGTKLRKITTDNTVSPAKITTTDYMSGSVYENNVLQFAGQEEGRIRFKPAVGSVAASFAWDYFMKDHLGNVRSVITEEEQVDKYPVATLEPVKIAGEQNYYTINTGQVVASSTVTGLPAYTNDNGIGNNPSDPTFEAANSANLYKLNGNTASTQTGLGITLKVMAGDRIDIFGKSYYFQNNTGGSSANSSVPITTILGGFIGGSGGIVAINAHGTVDVNAINTTGGVSNINTMISSQNSQSNSVPTRPRAFINCIIFDEQFKAVGYRTSMVGNNSTVKDHYSDLQNIIIPKNGYVYIYCSDESPVNVFFDNLQVVHTRGQLLEETHYYPFGLTMAGISSEAAVLEVKNKIKYNGIEEEKDLDLNNLSAALRDLDPQTGRWWQEDPKVDEMYSWSPYASNFDNPIRFEDHLGDEPCCAFLSWLVNHISANPNGAVSHVTGAVVGVEKSVEKSVRGVGNVIAHPINTLKGLAKLTTPQGQIDVAISIGEKYEQIKNAKGADKTALLFELGTDVLTAVVGTKGIGLMTKTAEAGNVLSKVGEIGEVANVAEGAGRIAAGSLKEYKSLVQQLSKPGSQLSKTELQHFEKLTEQFGGKLRYDLNPVKGKILQPHVQVEGLGTSVGSRHIWLGQ